ncbi:MAG: hypothetical protein ABII12_16145, partial [Planctomycetota bacterium]
MTTYSNHREGVLHTSVPIIALIIIASGLFASTRAHADCLDAPTQVTEQLVSAKGEASSVGMDQCGHFVVSWEEINPNPASPLNKRVLVQQYEADAGALGGEVVLSAYNNDFSTNGPQAHFDASVAMSLAGDVRVDCIADCVDCRPIVLFRIISAQFAFGSALTGSLMLPAEEHVQRPREPSVGIASSLTSSVTWSDVQPDSDGPLGLFHGPDEDDPDTIRSCDFDPPPNTLYCRSLWQPCMAMRPSDGYFAIAFACDELPSEEFSPYNIALQVYDPNGTLITSLDGPDVNDPSQWVNDSSLEDPSPESDSDQVSPAVSFVGNDIVVTWVGPRLAGCAGAFHVYARRFKFDDAQNPGTLELRDPNPTWLEGRPGMFIVDNDVSVPAPIIDPSAANPTVALLLPLDPTERRPAEGSFVVAWNASIVVAPATWEVRAQYFDSGGTPLGREFTVNQVPGADNFARLAKSGQHTLVYGPDQQVVATWTEGLNSDGVYFTLLPLNHHQTTVDYCQPCIENPGLCRPCFKGDVNDDCVLNGLDIQPFVDVLLASGPGCSTAVDFCRADMDENDVLDSDDVPIFVHFLLIAPLGESWDWRDGLSDCNENGVPDANDIAYGTSEDCNKNFIPDECDLDPTDPDGDGLVSNDLNTNGVPDECEPDCNGNGIPDDKDIADETSADVNSNGVPDECEPDCNDNDVPDAWDISRGTSDDCNENGWPDECEPDCNENGVPDD